VTAIVIASLIAALLLAPALHSIGFNWRSAWLFAAILALGIGASAAHSLDLI
jgi:hypothetical protein